MMRASKRERYQVEYKVVRIDRGPVESLEVVMVVTQEIRIEDERIPERARTTRAKESNTAKPSEPFVGAEGSDAKQGRERDWIERVTALVDFSRAPTLTQASASRDQTSRRYQALGRNVVSRTNGEVKGERGLNENPDQAQGSQRKGVPERLNMTPRTVILLSFFRLPFRRLIDSAYSVLP